MMFWARLSYRLSAISGHSKKNEAQLISELKKIRLYNPEKVVALLSRNYTRDVAEYDFSVRLFNCFRQSGIETIEQVAEKTEKHLLEIRNLGKKSIREVKGILSKHGYSLKEE